MADDNASGLSQADFRKLLATPRVVSGQAGGRGGFSGGGIRALGAAGRQARVPVPQTPSANNGGFAKPKPKKTGFKNPNKEVAATSKYRDRATERREGANPDYIETEQILNTLEGAASDIAPDLLYEQSKFLGGDREHTHLVKGLDYALLNKMRQEDGETEAATGMDLDSVFDSVQKASAKDKVPKEEIEVERPETHSIFASNIFQYAIEDAKKKPPKVNDMFIPGRTVFVFELPALSQSKRRKGGIYDDDNPYNVPTTMVRSRADVDETQKLIPENSEGVMVMQKVLDVLSAIRTGDRKSAESEAEARLKRKLEAVAAAKKLALAKLQDEEELKAQKSDEEGEDIFADAGRDYVLDPELDSMGVDSNDIAGPMVGPERPDDIDVSHYFGEESDNEEEVDEDGTEGRADQAPILGPSRPDNDDLSMYFGAESDEEVEEENQEGMRPNERDTMAIERPVTPTAVMENDEYLAQLEKTTAEKSKALRKSRLENLEVDEDADYYSAYGLGMGGSGHGQTAYDSDDDDDDESQATVLIDKGTHKNKRAQLGRFDFDTEEGFNRYKDTVEAVPKTAFQYGVKMSDGRKTGKWDEKSKGLSKDEKLDRDWQRISRLMENNKGGNKQKSGGESTGHREGRGGNWRNDDDRDPLQPNEDNRRKRRKQ